APSLSNPIPFLPAASPQLFESSTATDFVPCCSTSSPPLVRGRPSATSYLSIFFLPNASLLLAKAERKQGLELTLTAKLAPNQGCVHTIRAVCGIVLL